MVKTTIALKVEMKFFGMVEEAALLLVLNSRTHCLVGRGGILEG